MFKKNRSFRLLGCAAVMGGLLWSSGMAQAAPGKSGERSYYFSRTAKPYANYEEWLKANPRQTHPYHATVHGPLFHQPTPETEAESTRPIYDHPAFRAEKIKPPWGYNRILWVNDRYYEGKYYPTEKKE